jgi:tRNA/tmRNA/rRNA uracil-C5-methylase (TrmA/RlmC/RlmD family)
MAQLDAVSRAKLVVVPGAAGAASAMAASVDVVIADPPRKGLDAELTMQLAAAPPQRFIYVSCDLDSLLRDAEQLTAPRRLKLASLTAFNLMPFTEHVETVACFERV